ncbi:hypothetical protein Taro_030224 [Colocasia esculenta]|uniref:Uncharacterized protein n=1 Tax=Colocasia esculenta TaxID=4460 RepID=A0A843VNJ1_COLES|nr:hypothetical protein [Colocasia esculenta]
MSSSAVVPLLLLLCAVAAPASSATRIFPSEDAAAVTLPQQEGTVHDLLPDYGLPPGLLPASVKDYSMDSNGQFTVRLTAPCYVQFTELVYYDRTIKGKISYGSITDLSGIQVKKLFAWLPVTGMVADGSSIEFQVGFLSEKLPTSMFAEIPSCRKNASSSCHGAGAGAAVATLEAA